MSNPTIGKRKQLFEAKIDNVAAETADIVLAADALPEKSLNAMLYVFDAQARATDRNNRAEREMFHAVTRLLAAVRDVRGREWEALKREIRLPRGTEPTPTN